MSELVEQLLEGWDETDIEEQWTQFTTVQPFRNTNTGEERVVYISRCETCSVLTWLTFKRFNQTVISEHKLSDSCGCDRMEAALDQLESANSLPLHRTQATFPPEACSTCGGGGCLDCTDPS